MKTDLRSKTDLQTADTINEQKEAVKGQQPLNTGATPSFSAPGSRGRWRRSSDTSDGPRHTFAERKQLCRRNSLISLSRKAALPKTQTAPSSGDCLGSLPCEVKNVDLAGQMIAENNSSPSHLHNSETNQRDDPQQKLDFSVFAKMQDGNMEQDKITSAIISEEHEGSLSTQNSSPLWTIQRKVRVYERKRRKLETRVEYLQPGKITDNPRLKLLEIFQSSDDTDMDFLGFESEADAQYPLIEQPEQNHTTVNLRTV